MNRDGRKDLIGIYLSENEGAKFWLSVLTDLKQRGVEDILVACVDGLSRNMHCLQKEDNGWMAFSPKLKTYLLNSFIANAYSGFKYYEMGNCPEN